MKNTKTVKVNGVDFNAEVAAKLSEDAFVQKQMPLKFQDMAVVERERALREVHKLSLEKVSDQPDAPAVAGAKQELGEVGDGKNNIGTKAAEKTATAATKPGQKPDENK